jgi:hypothetical protein
MNPCDIDGFYKAFNSFGWYGWDVTIDILFSNNFKLSGKVNSYVYSSTDDVIKLKFICFHKDNAWLEVTNLTKNDHCVGSIREDLFNPTMFKTSLKKVDYYDEEML